MFQRTMGFLLLVIALVSSPAFSIGVGWEQTFGSNGYQGSRVPLTLVKTKIDEQDVKWLEFGVGIDSYTDDLVAKRFYAFEPRFKVSAPSEASFAASYRFIPTTDSFVSHDIGIEFNYTALQPHHDLQSDRLIDEIELGLSVHRKSYSDGMDILRGARTTDFSTSEIFVLANINLLNNEWGGPKPKIYLSLGHSFYSTDVTANERPAPMAIVGDLMPLLSLYPNTIFNAKAVWSFGRPGGFSVNPEIHSSFFSTTGFEIGGQGLGFGLSARTGGFGVRTIFELINQKGIGWRNFITLGVFVTL